MSEGLNTQVGDTLHFEAFEPREFVAQGDMVVAIGHYTVKVKPTSKVMSSDWVMAFRLRDGKIVQFREWTDSAKLVRAFEGATASSAASGVR